MMDFTEADAETLAAKLEAMDLTDGERALLHALVADIAVAEVEGYTFVGALTTVVARRMQQSVSDFEAQAQKTKDAVARNIKA